MPLYLGIDAGGTKTDCAVSNGAELLGQASGASCKLACVGPEEARSRLQELMLRACEAGKIQPRQVDNVCIGISGASLPETVDWAEATIKQVIPGGTLRVIGDHVIAHRAAFGISPGVLVIAGTGSIAFGRNQGGQTARAGGWGPVVSDEGSGFWIGREAVSAALRLYDLGSRNGLLSTIAECWKMKLEDVGRAANSSSNEKFAELAAPVAAAADRGEPSAMAIAERAGKELAVLAGAVIKRLWPDGGVVRVALSGGVLQGSALVRQTLRQALREQYPDAGVSFAFVRPVLGALEIAADRGLLR